MSEILRNHEGANMTKVLCLEDVLCSDDIIRPCVRLHGHEGWHYTDDQTPKGISARHEERSWDGEEIS
jgi:hypothetical protein